MEEAKKSETHLTSAAAFVEGGIQDACDDACSICLDAFSDDNPSTVTSCKHEFHLQCILEWCQRSSQCPMCLQPISLKDPTSQELLEGVERERSFRLNASRTAAIFHHPTLGDFELQHLPVGANDSELEERIIQHLAAAAAMGRARHITRREGHRIRPSAQGRPQLLVFSTRPDAHVTSPASSSPDERGEAQPSLAITSVSPSSPPATGDESHVHIPQASAQVNTALGSAIAANNGHAVPLNNSSLSQSVSPQDRARGGSSSDVQSFSESLKSRFSSMSMRYKDSISKSTRGWKERWFSRNTSMADLGSEVKREVNSGIATVSRMMERLETHDNNRDSGPSQSTVLQDNLVTDASHQPHNAEIGSNDFVDNNLLRNDNQQAACHAGSSSS